MDFGEDKLLIARAKASETGNTAYAVAYEKHAAPYQNRIQKGLLSNTEAEELMIKIYADAVILDWQTLYKGKWVQGIPDLSGKKPLPFTKANLIAILKEMPDLFEDIQEFATKTANYIDSNKEEAMGNSPQSSDTT